MKRIALVLALLPCGTVPARADIISGAIAIATWYSSLGAIGTLLVNVAVTAALYGIQYLISNAGRNQANLQNEQRPGFELPEFESLLRVSRAYGTITSSGGVFFHRTVPGSGSSTPNRWLFGLALSEGVCDGLESIIINGVECSIGVDGNPQTAPWHDGSTAWFTTSFRNGADDQAMDPIIASYFSSPPDDFFPDDGDRVTKWSKFRQRGVCTIVLDMDFGTDADHHTELWGTSVPNIQIRFRGLRLYDRTDDAQDPDDASTWTHTDIATICLEDYMVAEIGAQVPRSKIDDWSAAQSIEIDRENIATLAGTEKRGRVNGKVSSEESPVDVLGTMSQQNRAIIGRSEADFTIRADRPASAVATIHKGLWRSQIAFRNQVDERSSISGVVAQFFPASRFNGQAETAYPGDALDDPNATRVNFRFCDSPSAAQRLAYAQMTEAANGRTISGTFDPAVLVAPGKTNGLLQVGDDVWFDAPAPYDAMSGLYKVDGLELSFADFSVNLALTGTSADVISGWSTELETEFTDEEAA